MNRKGAVNHAAMKTLNSVQDLCDFFGADTPRSLNKRVYKDTSCGASISLYFNNAEALHNGGDPRWQLKAAQLQAAGCRGFTIQTIVEGIEATVDSDEFLFPVDSKDIDDWVQKMETEAEWLWEEEHGDDDDADDDW